MRAQDVDKALPGRHLLGKARVHFVNGDPLTGEVSLLPQFVVVSEDLALRLYPLHTVKEIVVSFES